MDVRPHIWHTHISFYRQLRLLTTIHRFNAKACRGDHGKVKHHRDLMRHYAKTERR